ncbi:hypothetical protein [Phenylobacterium sp.]|uniref:hypothetical protein n=1 Tax=Phenylobacterium sp. TaxID=1871053 RepID=UPI00273319B9|nr:hypothetical protein [Phenylobacterium sp.]MDP3852650.1 hypothetical protein [Phenylobacterium sp.]
MRSIVLATLAAVCLSGCSGPSAKTEEEAAGPVAPPAVPADPTFTGFKHDQKQDLFGYYYPTGEVKVGGKYKLDHLHIAGPIGFGDWVAGKRTKTYGPVMMEFQDITSPARTNALGNTSYSVKLRVLPTAYALNDEMVRFVGKDDKLGEVRLDAKIDAAALKTAQLKGKDAPPVITGALQVGDTPFKTVTFTWRGGD